jgi:hypothetical protein
MYYIESQNVTDKHEWWEGKDFERNKCELFEVATVELASLD